MKCLLLVSVVVVFEQIHGFERKTKPGYGFGDQDYGYVDVRPGVHLFWWFYYNSMTDKNAADVPLILWVAGGPGLTASAMGNLIGVGPTTIEGKYRNGTWMEKYNLLFVDSPVGTGFSYVDSDDLYATDNLQTAEDFLKLLHGFFLEHPEFETTPFYIHSHSYGTKVGVELVVLIQKNIGKQKIRCNLKGIVLENGYISHHHIVNGYGTQFYIYGLIDQQQRNHFNELAAKSNEFSAMGLFAETKQTTVSFFDTIMRLTDRNEKVLHTKKSHKGLFLPEKKSEIEISKEITTLDTLNAFDDKLLIKLMNERVKIALGIPEKVKWSSQKKNIVPNIYDFAVSKLKLVQYILNETPVEVHVITSNADGLISPHSIENWVNSINWPQKKDFERSPREYIWNNGTLAGYRRNFDKFGFYWLLNAAHMSFVDNPAGLSEVLSRMIK